MKSQNVLFIATAVIAISFGLYIQTQNPLKTSKPELNKIILLPQSKAIGKVDFRDHKDQIFNESRLLNKWSIVFFGFTNCPDICPTTLQTLSDVKATLASTALNNTTAWSPFQVIMVSVDPERDNIEKLNSYVPWFDEEFIGLAGELEYTKAFAKRLGILFYKSEQQSESVYEVDHSASLILINPQGEYVGAITAPHKAEQISADLITLANSIGNAEASYKPANKANTQTQISENQSLSIDKTWIRPAPPGVSAMAAYMTIKNTSDNDILISDIEAPDFEMAMIHNTVIEDGIASMNHLDSLVIKAGETLTLKPLETHIMLMRPNRALSEGSTSRLTLIDKNGHRFPLLVPVKQLEGK